MGPPPCASDKDAHPERPSGVEGLLSVTFSACPIRFPPLTNNSHSETRFRPSRFLCDLSVSALNPIVSPSTFNLQLLTSFPSRDLSFHALTNCPFHKSFVLHSYIGWGGVGGGVQKFLKNYFSSGRISTRIKHLQRADSTSHESPVTKHQSLSLQSNAGIAFRSFRRRCK